MRFLVDNQLPTALAAYLRKKGFHCEHVLDVALDRASDAEVCNYATSNALIVVSKDEDFFHLANRPQADFQFVWIRLGNCRTAALLEALERVWKTLEESLRAGERVVEIR